MGSSPVDEADAMQRALRLRPFGTPLSAKKFFLHGTTVSGVAEGKSVPVGVNVIVGERVGDGVNVGRGVRVGNGVQVGSGVRVGVSVGGNNFVGVTSTSDG